MRVIETFPYFTVTKLDILLIKIKQKYVCFFFSPEVWSKVRSIVRIKVANYTMLLVLIGCAIMVITGKRARDRGESITQRNLDWHKKYSEGKEEEIKNIGVFGK